MADKLGSKGIYNWDEPIPTKSGRRVSEIWADLKHAWASYKMYRMNDDKINMVIKAKAVRKLQIEMGVISVDQFPELGIFQ